MATATASPRQARPIGPGPFTMLVLPITLLFLLVTGVAATAVYVVFWYLPPIKADRDLVWRRLEDPLQLFGRSEISGYYWLLILIPLLTLGIVYIVWMYVRDGVTIGWAWSSFLALLRGTVYAIIALVFLLPSLQAWEKAESESKVVVVCDVSQSMLLTRDEIPSPEMPLEKLPTRQDKVLAFLEKDQSTFFKKLTEKNPVTAYRFGRVLDESYLVFDKAGQVWTQEAWEKRLLPAQENPEAVRPIKDFTFNYVRDWLKPDLNPPLPDDADEAKREAKLKELNKQLENLQRLTGATNLGTPLRRVFDREKNNLPQGIVVFTDGRNTEGSTSALRELIESARRSDPPVPIFVVAVGEDRERVRLEITDLRVPDQIRPEDRFRATVDLTGDGLVGREKEVFLDIFRVNSKTEKPEGEILLVEVKPNGEASGAEMSLGPKVTLKSMAKFQPGNPPHAQVEYLLDAASLAKAMGKEPAEGMKLEFKDDAEGQLRFQARVARDPREDFAEKEHKSEGANVQVVKRPIRILVVTSGPMRDYQFLCTMLDRESRKGRCEMSIYLQPVPGQEQPREGRVQPVDPERLLTRFPDKMQDEKLDKENPKERHYNLTNYDVMIAFDPDWTRLSESQLKMVEQWVNQGRGLIVVGGPVNTLQLARPGAHKEKLRPIIDIYPVHLADSRVQEVTRETDRPWRLNFPGATADMEFLKLDEEDPKANLMFGWEQFFHAGPKGAPEDGKKSIRRGIFNFYPVKGKKDSAVTVATFTDDRAKLEDGQEQPYLVIGPYGSGKVMWIGSAEMWRLRSYKEAYHERFWSKLARYVAGNLAENARRIRPNIGQNFTVGNYVTLEVKALGPDMKPLPQRFRPQALIKLPKGIAEKEAIHKVDLDPKPVPKGSEWDGWYSARYLVKAPGLYGVELRVPETGDSESTKFNVKESNPELDNTRPDFAELQKLASDAEVVMKRVPEDVRRELRERLQKRKAEAKPDPEAAKKDKEKEAPPEERLRLYFDLSTADLIPNCMVVETKTQRNRGGSNDLWDGGFTIWPRDPPIQMSTVLAIIAGLLSVEWLTRKLLRLA